LVVVVGSWLVLDDTFNKKMEIIQLFFLPSLGYQETRGHSDKYLNARKMPLPVHISHQLLFCIRQM